MAATISPAQIYVTGAPPASTNRYRSDQILVQPKAAALPALERFHAEHHTRALHTFPSIHNLQVLAVPPGETVASLLARYRQSDLVEFAEPDYLIHAAAIPNDPRFQDGTMWALDNHGQNGGTPHADVSATNAWDVLTSASNIVVAVVDSGIRATHEDLAANMWVNPNGGGSGFDAFTGTNNPSDATGHGTLVAGLLGAVGNNGKGITGIAWNIRMMNCRCLDSTGNGSDSTLLACFEFARTNGARIINASLTSSTPSLAVSNEMNVLRAAGIIVVAAAGTGIPVVNVDVSPTYPACYAMDNIVSVIYSTRTDTLGRLSYYGATNTLLAAPGDQLFSTFSTSDSYYYPSNSLYVLSSTSFAAAYVSGACALLMAQYPADGYRDTIARLVNSVDPIPALAGTCRTGGRLNLAKALHTIRLATTFTNGPAFQMAVSGGLNRTCSVEASTNLTNWSPVYTNTSSTNGTFGFTDPTTNSPERFYRATATQ